VAGGSLRGTFSNEINKGGIDGLIKALTDKNKQLASTRQRQEVSRKQAVIVHRPISRTERTHQFKPGASLTFSMPVPSCARASRPSPPASIDVSEVAVVDSSAVATLLAWRRPPQAVAPHWISVPAGQPAEPG
jgi:hypothetical protein